MSPGAATDASAGVSGIWKKIEHFNGVVVAQSDELSRKRAISLWHVFSAFFQNFVEKFCLSFGDGTWCTVIAIMLLSTLWFL